MATRFGSKVRRCVREFRWALMAAAWFWLTCAAASPCLAEGPPQGALLLVGGPSRDHRAEVDTYRELVRRSCKGTDSTIAFVTSASSQFRQGRLDDHLDKFARVGVKPGHVHVVSIMSPDDSPDVMRDTPFAVRMDDEARFKRVLDHLRADDVVFLDGGDQKRLAWILSLKPPGDHQPSIWDIIASRYVADPSFLLAGTSAGAAAMPRWMIHEETLEKPASEQYPGFNLPGLEGVAVDTHYDQRERTWRFPDFMRKIGVRVGLGLPENGGVYLKGGVAEVFSETGRRRQVTVHHFTSQERVDRKFFPSEQFLISDFVK